PAFINDQYWLLLPLHVAWDRSATVTDQGMNKLPLGNASADRVVVKYPPEGSYAARRHVGTLRWRRQGGRGDDLPPGRHPEAQRSDSDVGGPQEGWPAPYLNRSPRDGGRKARAGFPLGCVGQSDGIRKLDQRTMNMKGPPEKRTAPLRL